MSLRFDQANKKKSVICTLNSNVVPLWEVCLIEFFSSAAVDGGYSVWKPTSNCTVTCGGGTRTLSRTCTNPPPSNRGRDCNGLGPAQKTVPCNEQECRKDKLFIDFLTRYLLNGSIL